MANNIDDKYSAEFIWTDSLGGYKYTIQDINNLDSELEKFAAELYQFTAENARAVRPPLVSTGSLLDPKNYKTKISDDQKGKQQLDISMVYYYDFINQGVKGVQSSAKAPNSPYQFKNYGMNEEGRKSIKNWVNIKGLISQDKTKKRKISIESQALAKQKLTKSALDKKTDQVIWAIKAYGIKETNYFTDAVEKAFKNFQTRLGDSLIKDLQVRLILSNNKKNVTI